MTLHATAVNGGKQIDVTFTYGPARVSLTEDLGHVKSFWAHLGMVIERAEEDLDEGRPPGR